MKESTTQTKKTPSWEEIRDMISATSEQMKETDRRLQETDRIVQETVKQLKESNKRYDVFANEFGKMVEDLCKPAALEIFKKEVPGIDHIYEGPRHMRKDEEEMEVDVLLCNSTAAVAVEVKTTCFKKDIDHFLKQMRNFKTLFHEFKNKTLYLAIAAMRYANGSDQYAQRKGLYVLTPHSDGLFSMERPRNRKEF